MTGIAQQLMHEGVSSAELRESRKPSTAINELTKQNLFQVEDQAASVLFYGRELLHTISVLEDLVEKSPKMLKSLKKLKKTAKMLQDEGVELDNLARQLKVDEI